MVSDVKCREIEVLWNRPGSTPRSRGVRGKRWGVPASRDAGGLGSSLTTSINRSRRPRSGSQPVGNIFASEPCLPKWDFGTNFGSTRVVDVPVLTVLAPIGPGGRPGPPGDAISAILPAQAKRKSGRTSEERKNSPCATNGCGLYLFTLSCEGQPAEKNGSTWDPPAAF